MKFGFYLSNNGPTVSPDNLIAVAQKGEELGFDCAVVGDHIIIPKTIDSPYPYTVSGEFPGAGGGDYLEQLTLLTFLAGATTKLRLVPSVMILPNRHPVIVAKTLATLDYLSKGRLTLGIGVGWMKEEFEALDLPPFEERGAVSDEYLRAIIELWTSDEPEFHGKYVNFSGFTFLPKPVQKPHPPIWVGGQSRAAIRRAARLGDGWHPLGAQPVAPLEPEEVVQDLQLLGQYAEAAGRDPEEIELSLKAPLYDSALPMEGGKRRRFTGGADDIIGDVQAYKEAGAKHLIFDARGQDMPATLERLDWLAKDIIPKV